MEQEVTFYNDGSYKYHEAPDVPQENPSFYSKDSYNKVEDLRMK